MSERIRRGGSTTAADLAKAAPFQLGSLRVEPAARTIELGTHTEVLEPRAMRVLVALGETPGLVLTRDDLIELCWDGQIVSDNAINRVIFLLRRAFDQVPGGAVRLETITKVGFRIVVDAPDAGLAEAENEPSAEILQDVPIANRKRKLSRRVAIGSFAVLGVAGAFGVTSWLTRKPSHIPDPRALDLYRRGETIASSALPGTTRQAMDFFKQAVAIDPDYADAWAAIAITYKHAGDGFIKGPRDAYPRLIREAAQRALALDPDNAEAQMALVSIDPNFRHWLQQEANYRTIVRRHPGYWYGHGQLGLVLQDVGRFEEALVYRRRVLELKPMVPRVWSMLAFALHYAGRDQEAETVLDQAAARWPAHPDLWGMRFHVLMGGKRYTEAAAFARDPRTLPDMMPEEAAEGFARTGDALAGKMATEQIVAAMRARPVNIDGMPFTAPLMAELGDVSGAFEGLEVYFFGGSINGQRVPPPRAYEARIASVLFAPSIIALRGDPRHGALLKRVGLEDYWRKSGTQPDFRRG